MERIDIDFYTDPICCWSWALEKPLRQLVDNYPDKVRVRYVMYAMLTDWESYHDPVNSVSTPAQMGPVWMHASVISGVSLNDRVWHLDPPSSSVPAALAVKCAYLQSDVAGKLYLDAIRQSFMNDGMNVSKRDVLIGIAKDVEFHNEGTFNADAFQKQLGGRLPLAALKKDMEEATLNKIGRFPTLIIKSPGNRSVIISGYRPYDALLDAVEAATGKVKTPI